MKFSKKLIYISIFIVFALVVFIILKKSYLTVKQIPLEKRVVQRTISSPGVVKSRNDADISFASMGKLKKLYVDKNSRVSKGDVLGYIDNFVDYQSAQAYKDARDIALRDRDLFVNEYENDKDAAGGESEYDIQLRKYDELISKAEASYQSQLGIVSKGYIYAPFDGYIVDVYKKEGEITGIGEKVIKIADLDTLYFEIQVDQEDYGYLSIGQNVEINLESFINEVFDAKVNILPKYVKDTSTGNFTIDIEFSGENKNKILLGMKGDAHIILAKTDNEVFSLAFDDIYYDIEDKPYVYVIENKKIKKMYIELGLQGDIFTEVKTPIQNTIIAPLDSKQILVEGKLARITK